MEDRDRNQKADSDMNACPCGHPQAPAVIRVEDADKASDNHPYNPGGTPNGPQGGKSGSSL